MKHISQTLLLLTLAIIGCGPSKPEVVVVPSAPATESHTATTSKTSSAVSLPNATGTTDAQLESTRTALVATAVTGTAEATFQQVLIAFQEGRLDTVFDFLPASYQADVEKQVREFAKKMDSDVWSKTFETLTKLANVMKSKKAMILEFEAIKRAPFLDSVKSQWDAIANGINDVATSEVNNIENLKNAEVRRLLASASELLSGMSLPKFGNVSVITVAANDDTTMLSYRESKDGEETQVEFVKVEGKWLPKSIATGWSEGIRDLKARLQNLPVQVASVKPLVIQQLDGIIGMLDKMHASKTQEELNLALIELTFSIRLASLTAQEAMLEATLTPRKGNDVRFEINRELKDNEQTKLKEAVFARMDDATIDYELIASDGKTRCRFTPILEPELLVDVLRKHFDGAEVRLDSEKKMIYVELK